LSTDQGGSLELGGDNATAGIGSPYIDFHFAGKTQDYSVRLQNDADGRLSLWGSTLYVSGSLGIGIDSPTHRLHVNDFMGIRQNYLYMGGGNKWSSLSYNAYHSWNNSVWVYPDTSQAAVTLEIDSGTTGWKPRFEVWATPKQPDRLRQAVRRGPYQRRAIQPDVECHAGLEFEVRAIASHQQPVHYRRRNLTDLRLRLRLYQ
jgi:hypothetical protein